MPDLTPPTDGGRGSGATGESRDQAGFSRGGTEGSPIPAKWDQGVTHRLRVDPSRSMKAITGEVEMLLDGLEEGPRHSGALLASELIAQLVGPGAGWNSKPVGLTIQVREDAIRLEATGPVAPLIEASADHDAVPEDPFAGWGVFEIERLADRWGRSSGSRRNIWAEIDVPA